MYTTPPTRPTNIASHALPGNQLLAPTQPMMAQIMQRQQALVLATALLVFGALICPTIAQPGGKGGKGGTAGKGGKGAG